MDIREEYKQHTVKQCIEWWCRQRNDAAESHLNRIRKLRLDILKWRIGWARTLKSCVGQDILEFLASISDCWECGRKTGAKHARCGEHDRTDKKSLLDYRVNLLPARRVASRMAARIRWRTQ